MPISTASIPTSRAARHIEQLTSNLEHCVPEHCAREHTASVELAVDGRTEISFGTGAIVLMPYRDYLNVLVTAADSEALAGAQRALTGRLRSLAGEELRVNWTAPIDGGELQVTDPVVDDYLLRHCTPADGVLAELVVETRLATGDAANMQISADEGTLLTMLTRMVGARFAIEVGVFTGYSSICIARGLAADGRLLACDTSGEWTSIASRYWQRAGVADRIELKLGPAMETLRALPADQPIDIAFIDADKASYPAYYEELIRRLRPGGLIALDNVLLGGRVLDPAYQEEHHQAMRRLNGLIAGDQRVEAIMLTLRDGLTLVRKR